jgi:hypothetical protein
MNRFLAAVSFGCFTGVALFIVGCGQPPKIVSFPPATETNAGSKWEYSAVANGTGPIRFEKQQGPNDLVLREDGRISWIPMSEGEYTIAIRATNRKGIDMQTFTVHVKAPPKITSMPPKQGQVGEQYSYRCIATGSKTISFAKISGPSNLEVSQEGDVVWTPGEVGEYEIEIEATNSIGSDTQRFSVSVAGVVISEKHNEGAEWGKRLWSKDETADIDLVEYLINSSAKDDADFKSGLVEGLVSGGKGKKDAEDAARLAFDAATAANAYRAGKSVGEGLRSLKLQIEEAGRQKHQMDLSGPERGLAWKTGFCRGYAGEKADKAQLRNALRLYFSLP